MTSHTSGHESRAALLAGRLDYPDWHCEADNRLSWLLGLLDERYGDEPVYVHLTRDPELVARSYAKRFTVQAGIASAFASGVIRRTRQPDSDEAKVEAMRLMVATVTANIRLFLKDKSKVVTVDIAAPHSGYDAMVDMLGAEGDMDAAHVTLATVHNPSRR